MLYTALHRLELGVPFETLEAVNSIQFFTSDKVLFLPKRSQIKESYTLYIAFCKLSS